MRAPRLDHLEWSKTRSTTFRHSLADSAIAAPDLAALGLPDRAALPHEGSGVLADLERALGARVGAPGGRVLVTAGASEAIACVSAGLLEPGDEVLAESPGYEPHRVVPALFGAAIRTFPRPLALGRPPRASLAPAIEAALGPATRLVIVSDLHNPSGTALEPDEVAALEALGERRGLWLVCDETFRDVSDRAPGTVAARGGRWVAIGSLTKSYGLGGLRIGWVAGGRATLERCAVIQNALSVQPALPSVALALALAPHLDRLRARSHDILARNHERWADLVARPQPFDAVRGTRGTTTWCVFPGAARGDAFAAFAAERFDLALPPGRFFGDPGGVRVALCDEPRRFARSLEALGRALAEFAPAIERVEEVA